MIPHALVEIAPPGEMVSLQAIARVMTYVLVGLLTMFFIERFFCFHHHDVPDTDSVEHVHKGQDDHTHVHDLTWSGAAIGLTLHSIIAGIALAASVNHVHADTYLAGFGTFLIILLHKPFDAMTIATLMAKGGWPLATRHAVNGLFALAVPLGMVLFHWGLSSTGPAVSGQANEPMLAYALAFTAGSFLCIALSDLLPELQFHTPDRVKLSLALLLGVMVSIVVGRLEALAMHQHGPLPAVEQPVDDPPIEPTAIRILITPANVA